MKVGFDFNGVVDIGFARPDINSVIITGNTDVKTVLDWLTEHGIQCAVYFMPKRRNTKDHRYAAAVWKSEMVRRLELDEFYDDDQRTVEIIQASCQNCRVLKV